MTKCVNGDGLTAEFVTAYGTINYVIVRTGVYTVGSFVVFYNNAACGVTECVNGDGLTAEFLATNGTVNYVIVRAGVYTVGCFVVFYNNVACSMTESIYCLLCYEYFAAYRAVLAFGKTGVGAIGCDCLVNNLGVTESIGIVCLIGVTAN